MLSEFIPEHKRKLYELEMQLVELERGEGHVKASDLILSIQQLSSQLEDSEKMASKESKSHREDSLRRVRHLKNSLAHLRSSIQSYVKRTKSVSSMKEELFGTADLESGDQMNALAEESGSLYRSNQMINSYISLGQQTFADLLSQKERVKGIQRKVLDIVNYLGLSNNIMRSVERRDIVDKWIVYCGMALITGLLFFIWWHLRK